MDKQAITTLYNRAAAGDPAARAMVSHAVQRVYQGDRKAQIVIGALKEVHDHRVKTRNAILARDLYNGVRRGNAVAREKLGQIVEGARQGRPSAQKAFQMLQGIHLQSKAASWKGPGSPRTGHYPMPSAHRVGVYIPGVGEVPIPQNLPSIPGMPSIPGIPGYPPPTPQPQGNFLPLTPQALVELLGLVTTILRAALPQTPMGERSVAMPQISPLAPKPVEIRKPTIQAITTSLQKPAVTTYKVRPEMFAI